MSLVGTYRINFTDPKKPSFIVEPYSTNGTVNATSNILHSRATKADTSLVLPGQYVPKYGEIIAENMVRLLENFAGDIPPRNAIEGQLWYDTGDSFEIVSSSATGIVLKGHHTSAIADYASRQDLMTVWYGVANSGDNTPRSIDVRLAGGASITADGNTTVALTDGNGNTVSLPSAVIGGNLTPKRHSGSGRLRVARPTNGVIDWVDVADIECSVTPPTRDTLRDGTLWYDPNVTARTLKMWRQNNWIDTSGDKLKLSGGIMAGHIHLGQYVITTNEADIQAIDSYPAADVLVPRGYVIHKIDQAVSSIQTGTDRDITDLMSRMGVVETVLPGKFNVVGGAIDGPLVFGPVGTPTTLSRGIDMNGSAILNVNVAWNPSDYLTATTQGEHAIDKRYLATALRQHLVDEVHESRGYITEQPNGAGLIPGNIFFNNKAHTLSWHLNSTTYTVAANDNALVLSTGSNNGDVIELRHGSTPAGFTDPALRVSQSTVESYNTLYILDGQPQPISMGGITDLNDDTAAATKGFVRNVVESSTSGLGPIIGATFEFNPMANTYDMEFTRSQASPLNVSLYHTHMSDTLTYNYVRPIRNGGGIADLVGDAVESAGYSLIADEIPLSIMVTNLNTLKAPVRGALFEDIPMCGNELDVDGVNQTINGIEISELPDTVVVGMSLNLVQNISETEVESTTYVVTEFREVEEEDPLDPGVMDLIRYVVVQPTLPLYDETSNWKVWVGQLTPENDSRQFMTRMSFDYETREHVTESSMAAAISAQAGITSTAISTSTSGLAKISSNVTLTTSTTAAAAHDGGFLIASSNTAITYTIPLNMRALVNARGWSVEIYQALDGPVTIAAASGVTLVGAPLSTTNQHQVIRIRQVDTNQYVLY